VRRFQVRLAQSWMRADGWGGRDQIRVRGSEGSLTRSMVKAQRCFCSTALPPAYSLKLDHFQSCGRRTRPALTGLK
jgi:hypothetical protein